MKKLQYWSIRNKKTKKIKVGISCIILFGTKKDVYEYCDNDSEEPCKITITEGWR